MTISSVQQALIEYVKQDSPEPSLAIKADGLSEEAMKGLGFERLDIYWVISLEDAKAIVEGPDYDAHWEWERQRWEK